jgi:DNA-binding NarL/FixJ family response regulator
MKAVAELKPAMVIVDITLKDMSGIDLIKEIRKFHKGIIMLVISMHDESLYAERAFRAGAKGYVMKQEASESIVQAIRQVRSGSIYASKKMTDHILSLFVDGPRDHTESPLRTLTDREIEVFQLIGEGLSISEIGVRLHLSVKTIGTYRERIKEKLNLKNSTELLRYALNWVENKRESKTIS